MLDVLGKSASGVPGLDDILSGGFTKGSLFLIEGSPGTGKTTLALQYLLEGVAAGDRNLYITLSEGRQELIEAAATHGWSLDGIEIYELVPPELSLDPSREQSVVYSSDLELGETVRLVMDCVERIQPHCAVFDSLSDIRLLAGNPLRYRRQVLALKHYFAGKDCTVLFVDDMTEEMDDANLHSLVHGVVRLEQMTISYGAERRRLRVFKMRGRAYFVCATSSAFGRFRKHLLEWFYLDVVEDAVLHVRIACDHLPDLFA